jgi:hypothetical protein
MIDTLIHSIKYDCMDSVIKILIWLLIINSEPFSICNKGKKITKKSNYSDLLILLDLDNMFNFNNDNPLKDMTPPRDELKLFIDWLNDKDDKKWFNIPENYKNFYNFLFNKETVLGDVLIKPTITFTNGIIKEDKIIKYIEMYKKLNFLFNDEFIDNELLKNHPLIKGYKGIKNIANDLQINRTNNDTHNILKSFFSGYNYIILLCKKNDWFNLYFDNNECCINNNFSPHKEHFLEQISGLYFAIDLRNKYDIQQPMILSKIIDKNWINEIKNININKL